MSTRKELREEAVNNWYKDYLKYKETMNQQEAVKRLINNIMNYNPTKLGIKTKGGTYQMSKKKVTKRSKVKYWSFKKGSKAPPNYIWDGKGWRKR